jgi:hypothetical protein
MVADDALMLPAQLAGLPPPVGEIGHVVFLQLADGLGVQPGWNALRSRLQQRDAAGFGEIIPVQPLCLGIGTGRFLAVQRLSASFC